MNQLEQNLDGAGLKIGIVMSRFNPEVGQGLLAACEKALLGQGVKAEDITLATVPGALEIPLALRTMAQKGDYQALIAMGAVIRGETYHFEVVSNESAAGIMNVQLAYGVPVANAVLTTNDDDQAMARVEEKGRDAAQVAIEMARLVEALREHPHKPLGFR